jgi:prepilin-type N-terminal cleavage/methylation domain-containing protein
MRQSKKQNLESRIKNGFTLMEMLIVISIISVLLGLLYGALERAQKFSRRAITYTELKNIEAAFKQYEAHYHRWPTNSLDTIESGEDKGFIIKVEMAATLQGEREKGGATFDLINPAGIPFMEFSRYNSDIPVNPFKSLNQNQANTPRAYRVLFDTDGDKQIEISQNILPVGVIAPTDPITASIVVWTYIPATRTTDNAGTYDAATDVILGSWGSFATR